MTRVNLVSNPSLKIDTTGWIIVNGSTTIARVTTDAFYGTACLEVTKDAVANSGAAWGSATVAPSTVYTGSAYVKIPTGQANSSLIFYIYWYDASSVFISSSGDTLTPLINLNGWVRLFATGTSPSNATSARVRVVQPTAGTAGQKFLIDAVLLEQSSFAGGYLDDLDQGQENSTMDLALKRVPNPHLTGAELNADITLGSLVFNTVDENGVVWMITNVEGWWNLPVPQVPTVDRGFADGSYDVRGRFDSRAIVLTGVILPPNRTKLPAARQKLLQAANLVYRGDWLRLDEGPVKAAYVRLIGQPTIDTVNPRGRTEFSLQLRASDPIKYEWVSNASSGRQVTTLSTNNRTTTPGANTLTNNGDTNVAAVFDLTGPVYGPTATLKNATTNQTLGVVGVLRPARSYSVSARATDAYGTSTVTITAGRHNIEVGDTVTVASAGDASYNGTFTVTAVGGASTAYTIKYYTGRFTETTATGLSGTLTAAADTLKIDTYDREVSLNGVAQGSRSLVDTVVDWVYLQPGSNSVTYTDKNETTNFIKSYSRGSTQLVLSSVYDHNVYPGDSVAVMTPSALTSAGSYAETAAAGTTASTVQLPDTRGTLTSVSMGPVVYTSTAAQAVTNVAWASGTSTFTLTTEFDHKMSIGDYITVDGGYTTVTIAGGSLSTAVATGSTVKINTYTWSNTTNRLMMVTDAATGYTVGDEVEVANMGGDFDGVFKATTVSGTTLHLEIISSTAAVSTSTTAPTEATVRRVYRVADVPTANTLTYVKKSVSNATGTVAVSPVAGRFYLLGTGTAAASYRSGWMS